MSKIIVPVSAGKDSTACLVLALQQTEREVIAVHYDTGWDHPEVYSYFEYLEQFLGITIEKTVFEEAPTLPDLVRKYKKFPFSPGRFCTSRYKGQAFIRWLKDKEGEFEIWLGIREDESVRRKLKYGNFVDETLYHPDEVFPNMYPKHLSSRVTIKFPILFWTAWNCFDFLAEHNVRRNPLYDQGFTRVGCFPCMLAGKKEQERVFRTEFGKKQFAIIKELEKEIGEEYKYQAADEEDGGGCSLCNI